MLIQEWRSWNCGISRYLANSACQAASLNGGSTPDIGCHSGIDRPDSVSLGMPPRTTMTTIIAAQTGSQTARARRLPAGAASASGRGKRQSLLIIWPVIILPETAGADAEW